MFSLNEEVLLKLKLLSDFEFLFSHELGLRDFNVMLLVDNRETLRFCRTCPVPYSLKDRIGKKLD